MPLSVESLIVHVPSVPAVLVEMFSQTVAGFKSLLAWTTYFAHGVPKKDTVTDSSPFLVMLTVIGLSALSFTTWSTLPMLPK